MVTAIVLPQARCLPDPEKAIAAFEAFERRFAPQARVSIAFAGLSGLYMLSDLDAWDRLREAWYVWLMIAVWLVFAIMVYVLEPLGIDRRFRDYALRNKDRAFALAIGLHAVALTAAAIAIGAGVMGAHGGLP
jgi:uncharacterized membrane protein